MSFGPVNPSPVAAASVADSWAALMSMLGYERFAVHGGDIGSGITTALAYRHPERPVTRAGHVRDVLRRAGDQPLHPRSIDCLAELVANSGWEIEQIVERPSCFVIRMQKARVTT
jgi:pimeloyl-ACP methyl ester carboxylesterase